MMDNVEDVMQIPGIFEPLFTQTKRKNVLYGGRGSGKSHVVARYVIQRAVAEKTLILCTREFQNTIADSVHSLLKNLMEKMGLAGHKGDFFDVKRDYIIGANGSRFIFKGVHNNVSEIKSMEGVDICWVEEAQSMSQQSLDVLIPTIRTEGSILIFTFNPFKDTDPVYVMSQQPDKDTLVIHANYQDNPFFPEVLRLEMEKDKRTDYDKYLWVWEGQCLGISAAQIFRGKYEVKEFETPLGAQFNYGADWGFSTDPTAITRSFIIGEDLYIDQEAVEVGCDIVDLPALFSKVEGTRFFPIYADSARPETISAMQRFGFNVLAADKWQGSIEDGITYLRSFAHIYIHPRCKHTIEEFDLYQYKVDKATNQPLRIPMDKYNHCIDSLRYAHAVTMRANNGGKVYDKFSLKCMCKPFDIAGRATYVGTHILPGKTLICAMQMVGTTLYVVLDYELKGGVDFKKIRSLFPKEQELYWFPFSKLEDVPANLVRECIEEGIEPACAVVLPTENEATILLNRLFESTALRIFDSAPLAQTAINERVYYAGGKSEQASKINKMTNMAQLVEYTAWRCVGRFQQEYQQMTETDDAVVN